MKNTLKGLKCFIALVLILALSLVSCNLIPTSAPAVDLDSIPAFDGSTAYVIINDNVPFFTDEEITDDSYESYGELDGLGRCTVAIACIGVDLMPTEDRGSIGQVKPTGWHTVKYDCVDGKYLYNRCHLIGYQLTGENANADLKQTVITEIKKKDSELQKKFADMLLTALKSEGENSMKTFVLNELKTNPDIKSMVADEIISDLRDGNAADRV